MAVQDGEYRMWAALARRDDLPDAAHGAIIHGLLPEDGAFASSSWQHGVFKEMLPSLFARVADQGLRDRLIAAGTSGQIAGLIHRNVLGPDDVPGVLRHHRVTDELIAALARHETHREVVLDLVKELRLGDLVTAAMSCELLDFEELDQIPRVPSWLLDALVRHGLNLVTARLNAFGTSGDRRSSKYGRPAAWPSYEACHLVLERCPDEWPTLVEDTVNGQAMRHILLDCVKTEEISDEILASCVPALCLPEWATLTQPGTDHRGRLRHMARRVAAHPRLREMAAEQLKDAADQCVGEGRLLHPAKVKRYKPYALTSLAADLALTSGDSGQLAKLCTLVSRLPEPIAVQRRYTDHDEDGPIRPKLLLSSDSRISTLAALARNPHLEQSLVTGLLGRLHPVEVQWLLAYDKEVPAWLRQAATKHAASLPPWEVPRILSDTELDTCADPQAVMQGWLDTIRNHSGCFYDQVEYAILASRHRTDALVRQLPADIVLSNYQVPVASEALLRTCGSDPTRWQTMAEMLATSRLDHSETFGQFIDRFHAECDGA
ncbi:hypothetical protein ACFV2X_10485 [Streptomyces sp. NPDC059679]|uniref:hypothetical protein n=1 Tax=Streptomyces sp. NPDC059679 TaxID=3346903 RepID=UPI00367AA650